VPRDCGAIWLFFGAHGITERFNDTTLFYSTTWGRIHF
jgi:hypothetical protein